MDMSEMFAFVDQNSLGETPNGERVRVRANKLGFLVVQDFYTEMAIEGHVFNITAGTVATPLAADIAVTDTKCDIALDPALGYVVLPAFQEIAIAVGTGATINTIRTLSSAGISTTGGAMVPLNINSGGAACKSTARVAAAGGCVVAAELVTTTRQHFTWACPAAVAATPAVVVWTPRVPPTIKYGSCLYVQLAATGAGFTYYGHLDFIELEPDNVA